jgi:hypothetical protein
MVEFNDRRPGKGISDFSIEPPMHEGPQERTDLNVGGRPFRMAVHRAGSHYGEGNNERSNRSYHGWMIPFESGWEMHLAGAFDQHGNAVDSLVGHAHHEPTRIADPSLRPQGNIPRMPFLLISNADEFHEAIRKVSELPGGGSVGR